MRWIQNPDTVLVQEQRLANCSINLVIERKAGKQFRHALEFRFTSADKLSPKSIRYSDFVIMRLLYEATRDAALWNMQDNHQYAAEFRSRPAPVEIHWERLTLNTAASAECDELSAL